MTSKWKGDIHSINSEYLSLSSKSWSSLLIIQSAKSIVDPVLSIDYSLINSNISFLVIASGFAKDDFECLPPLIA